jgi:very-short-patch-repair endonuclease
VKFRRQHILGKYIADFYSSETSIVIEVDGDTHGTPEQESLDMERDAYFRSIGLLVLRYSNRDVLLNMEGVVESILEAITPLSSPRKRGEME